MKKLFLLLGILVIPALVNAAVWPAYHYNSSRIGKSPYTGPNCCDTVCSAPIEYSFASPVIDGNGNVFQQGAVTASGPWLLWCVDASNCSVKWTLQLNASNPTGGLNMHPTCQISGDTVLYVGDPTANNYLWAVYTTGTAKWTYSLGVRPRSSPVLSLDEATIYTLTDNGKLFAINADGTLKWSYSTTNPFSCPSSPAIGPDGTIYFGTRNDTVFAITDAGASATLKWIYGTGDEVWSTPSVGSDGTIYIGSNDGKLYALTDGGASATVKWSRPLGDEVRSSPALDEVRGIVYVGSENSRLNAINMSDGTLKWTKALNGDPFLSSPAVAYPNNMIYIGNTANTITMVENMTDSGRIVCSRTHNWTITSPAVDDDTSIWYNEYSYALHKLKCWIPPAGAEERSCARKDVYLSDNSPNPFAKETQISFTISKESNISLAVYDLSGRLVKELIKGNYASGTYTVKWDGSNNKGNKVKVGIYLYKLKTDSTEFAKKMTLISH